MKPTELENIEIYVTEEENHVQINDIQGHDLASIWDTLAEKYPGYDIDLCFRNMPAPMDILEKIGARLLEDCIELKITPQDLKPHDSPNITPLQMHDYEGFAKLHDTANPAPDMFWTSQRILPKWDIWRIFVHKTKDGITGYVMVMVKMKGEHMGEVFTLEAETPALRKALLSAAVASAFECGKSVVVYMVKRGDANAYADALAVGFRETGYYRGYCTQLSNVYTASGK